MTPYALLRELCGLSLTEAAAFHRVRPDTVKSWSAGRNRPPAGALDELRGVAAAIDRAAKEALELLRAVPAPGEIEIGYPADDHEAQALGFPCVGTWRAMAGRVIAELDRPVRLVPRGSTPATAAAVDVHGRRSLTTMPETPTEGRDWR